jgi:hypothetical protein
VNGWASEKAQFMTVESISLHSSDKFLYSHRISTSRKIFLHSDIKHGITAIIQPGGSMRDEEIIAAANEHNLAMVFTGIRHFKH